VGHRALSEGALSEGALSEGALSERALAARRRGSARRSRLHSPASARPIRSPQSPPPMAGCRGARPWRARSTAYRSIPRRRRRVPGRQGTTRPPSSRG